MNPPKKDVAAFLMGDQDALDQLLAEDGDMQGKGVFQIFAGGKIFDMTLEIEGIEVDPATLAAMLAVGGTTGKAN